MDFWRGGTYWSNIIIRDRTTWGNWWTSVAGSEEKAWYLASDIQNEGSKVSVYVPANNRRTWGFFIRCARI
ncbi:hypothetical protein IJI76_03615 [Candidatus Saccharibacteria bacterium]|nr:hypothetical protein [Candidatus Saccharibacteria bacterium]